jgi:hypothetical protein
MINYIAEFDLYKEQIPEFIVKLYHILEVLLPPVRAGNTATISVGLVRQRS